MIAAFIVDASIAMTWLFKDETTPATAALLGRLASETAIVPAIWHIAVANVIAMAERKKRITSSDAAAFVADLSRLGIEIDVETPQRAFSHLLPLCRAHQLTSYDATYLELAMRRRLPLATLDKQLAHAAATLGVKVLGR
jgi:predicted nucleic acid-binding protein